MKNTSKKIISLLIISVLILSLSACGNNSKGLSKNYDIVCVDYVCYDWVMGILADNPQKIKIGVINSGGVDMHSFQPSANDITVISNARMVVYIGGESEKWVDDIFSKGAAYGQANSQVVLNMFDRFVASPCFREYEDNDDEHIWSSPRIASHLATVISEAIECTFYDADDEKGIAEFEESSEAYINSLNDLYARCQDIETKRPLVLADRNPFYYLFEDCNIEYYAAFDGCSAETEASFETIIELANVCDENNLENIFVINTYRDDIPDIANSVIDASEVLSAKNVSDVVVSLISFDAAIPTDDAEEDYSYLAQMSKTIDLLEEVCGE